MSQAGFFDFDNKIAQLNQQGNPLQKLDDAVEFEHFRLTLLQVHHKDRKSNAGRKPYDVVLMFKMLILQSLYNLSDAQIEFQVRDRVSFMAFLNLRPGDEVPDEKTVWLFRERLTRLGLVKILFEQFDQHLTAAGLIASKGSIIDASFIPAPRQRNTRDENMEIKQGKTPESFEKNAYKNRQKDTDARWTVKNNQRYFGFKNHINIDAKRKLIRMYEVTDAAVHDSQMIRILLDDKNKNKDVFADSAYRSSKISHSLIEQGYRDKIHRKGYRNRPLSECQQKINTQKSRIRVRVEHVFGRQSQSLGGTLIRSIGIARAKTVIGLRNLVYNFDRYRFLIN